MGGMAVLQSVRSKPLAEAQKVRLPDFEAITVPLTAAGYAWLAARGLSKEVADQNGVRTAHKTFKVGQTFETHECLAIPSTRAHEVISIKYRSIQGAPPLRSVVFTGPRCACLGLQPLSMRPLHLP